MRIKLTFTPNTQPVPNNQSIVNGYVHTKCLGLNEYHNAKSDYCISGLLGGTVSNGGKTIEFPKGGYILLTSMNMEFINKAIAGALTNPCLGFGMKCTDIGVINETFHNGVNNFKTTDRGFILLKNGNEFVTLKDPDVEQQLHNHIIRKFGNINPNLCFDGLSVSITTHKTNKVKRLFCKNNANIANVCQFNVTCSKSLAEHIYHYGIGKSTGSGFGTVYTTQYHKTYAVEFEK